MLQLIGGLKELCKTQLGGFEAQNIMSPLKRKPGNFYENNNPSKSAVLALLYPKENIPHIILTVRADYTGVHSGQVSLPGGKYEEGDENFIKTALRETKEEIGINETNIEIIGALTDLYIPASNFIVYPILGIIEQQPNFFPDVTEVKQLLEVPIPLLLNENSVKIKPVHMSIFNEIRDVPCFDFYGHTVWGATAMILSEIKELLKKHYT